MTVVSLRETKACEQKDEIEGSRTQSYPENCELQVLRHRRRVGHGAERDEEGTLAQVEDVAPVLSYFLPSL